jgi:hypothetical protein
VFTKCITLSLPIGRSLCQLLRLLSQLRDRVDWSPRKDYAIVDSFQIPHMSQKFATDRSSRLSTESLKCGQNGAVVGEHMNGSAACTRRHCSSMHGTIDHVESHLDRSQCGCKSIDPRVATHRFVVLKLLVVAICPVNALASATNADYLVSGRCACGYVTQLYFFGMRRIPSKHSNRRMLHSWNSSRSVNP